MGRVARLLAIGLKGNPRQLKRYLNALEMRWATAQRRSLDLDRAVLAKLMVLEYAEPDRYRDLHRWTVQEAARSALASMEERARAALGLVAQDRGSPAIQESGSQPGGPAAGSEPEPSAGTAPAPSGLRSVPNPLPETDTKGPGKRAKRDVQPDPSATAPALPPEVQRWLESAWLLDWLALEPPLTDVDLAPYFELGRDTLPALAARARALPERLQQLLQRMASSTTDVRDDAANQAAALDAADASALTDAAIDRLPADKTPANLLLALATVAEAHPTLGPAIVRAASAVPYDALTAAVPTAVNRRFGSAGEPSGLREVLQAWQSQTTNPRLAAAARQVLEGRA